MDKGMDKLRESKRHNETYQGYQQQGAVTILGQRKLYLQREGMMD